MKKLVFSLMCCCAMLTSVRADDLETRLATIEEYLGYIVEATDASKDYIVQLPTYTAWLADQEYVTLPVWGPFEEFLTSQFENYIYYPFSGLLANLENKLEQLYTSLGDLRSEVISSPYVIYDQLHSMNYEGFRVRILDQDFSELETYLQNAVSSPLNYIYTQLQNGINVHGTLSADMNFDYSKFADVFSFFASAEGSSRFKVGPYKRYLWDSHIYDPEKPVADVVYVEQVGDASYDFLGFIEAYCNGQLQNMEQLQAGIVQIVGALSVDAEQKQEILDDAEQLSSTAESQMQELSNTLDFKNKYKLEVSDELFKSDVLLVSDGGSQLPQYITIGQFQLDQFLSQCPSVMFTLDTAEWRPFFDLCRSCFTIIIYLLICTLALSFFFLIWKLGAPCVRVLQQIFSF